MLGISHLSDLNPHVTSALSVIMGPTSFGPNKGWTIPQQYGPKGWTIPRQYGPRGSRGEGQGAVSVSAFAFQVRRFTERLNHELCQDVFIVSP